MVKQEIPASCGACGAQLETASKTGGKMPPYVFSVGSVGNLPALPGDPPGGMD